MTTTTESKAMTCPVCGSLAELFIGSSIYAGIWTCTNNNCGVSDNCEHDHYSTESIEIEMVMNGELSSYPAIVDVCDDCGITLKPSDSEYGEDSDEQ